MYMYYGKTLLSFTTDPLDGLLKLGRHEVLMAPHMCLGPGMPGLSKNRSWRDSFPNDFFFILEATTTN